MLHLPQAERIALEDGPSSPSPRRGEVDRVLRGRVRGFGLKRVGTPSPQPSPQWGEGVAAALLGLFLCFGLAIGAARAEKVGVAAAVNPDAFSSLSGSPQSQLNIGKSIFFSERINTTTSGLVQVLLVDGSTFTVGPGSDLVIDKFVYDPKKKTGQVVATFSKGVMRFVGGKISKNQDGVTIKTPSGVLAIRGGMAQGTEKIWSFIYGSEMTFTGKNGQTTTCYEPGYTIDLTGGTPKIRPTLPSDTNAFMNALTKGGTSGTGTAGTDGTNPPPKQVLAETLSLQDLISEANATLVDSELTAEEKAETPTVIPGDTTPDTPVDPIDTTTPPPPLPTITARVLSSPGSYTAFGNVDITDPASHGILGGDGNIQADDFEWKFNIDKGRLVGTVSGLTDGEGDGETHVMDPATLDFPADFTAALAAGLCQHGVCRVTDAKITQHGVPTQFTGIAVLKPDFFAYHVAETNSDNQLSDPLLIFGGKAHNFAEPSGKVYLFELSPDVMQQGAGMFASADSTPKNGDGVVSPLMLLEQGAEGDGAGSRAVWLQTSFVRGKGNSEGESFINIALGEWTRETGLQGARRGGSDLNSDPQAGTANPQKFSFSGDIASLAGPGESGHFLGTGENPNLVVGIDSTGTAHNIGQDKPLNPGTPVENQLGATYHIGVGTGTREITQTGDDDPIRGYAAGFAQKPGNGAPRTLLNTSPNGVSIVLNAETNTMSASLKVGDVGDGVLGVLLPNPRYQFEFGGDKRSAYIDNGIFAAFEKPGASKIQEDVRSGFLGLQKTTYAYTPTGVQGYIASANAINANAVLFPSENDEDQKQAFCHDCTFIKWGAWGSRLEYKNHAQQNITEDVHLGWWIGGDVVSPSDMPTTGSANYSGDAIGNVASKQGNVWNQYVATGDMKMNWNFGLRSGLLKIEHFDNKNFSGLMVAPGKVEFGGALLGSNSLAGTATGAFVGPNVVGGVRGAPGGVIGNFGVGNNNWKANGIFGGIQNVPH